MKFKTLHKFLGIFLFFVLTGLFIDSCTKDATIEKKPSTINSNNPKITSITWAGFTGTIYFLTVKLIFKSSLILIRENKCKRF